MNTCQLVYDLLSSLDKLVDELKIAQGGRYARNGSMSSGGRHFRNGAGKRHENEGREADSARSETPCTRRSTTVAISLFRPPDMGSGPSHPVSYALGTPASNTNAPFELISLTCSQVVPPESPCGCESGRQFGECCLQNGTIVTKAKEIMPSAPQTGKSERKCIFASHSDCGGGKSGDHFLSASVMRQIATTTITLVGPGYARSAAVRSDSFKVNLLCNITWR